MDDVPKLRHRLAELTSENARLAEEVLARDGFLAVAAHELMNALTPVVARVDRLRLRMASWSPEKIVTNLEQIEHATALFARRATTLLDISRMTSGKLRLDHIGVPVAPVARTVVESYQLLADHAGCRLTLDLPTPDLAIIGDFVALEQIIDNLVSNAIKYGAGTPILVSARIDEAGHGVRITVTDQGPGISSESQARIFERFERAVLRGGDTPGFGVGLWVVKQLSEAMEGSIVVTSKPGGGSRFCVTLPVVQAKDPR